MKYTVRCKSTFAVWQQNLWLWQETLKRPRNEKSGVRGSNYCITPGGDSQHATTEDLWCVCQVKCYSCSKNPGVRPGCLLTLDSPLRSSACGREATDWTSHMCCTSIATQGGDVAAFIIKAGIVKQPCGGETVQQPHPSFTTVVLNLVLMTYAL